MSGPSVALFALAILLFAAAFACPQIGAWLAPHTRDERRTP